VLSGRGGDGKGFFELSDKNHGFGFEANALATHLVTRDETLRVRATELGAPVADEPRAWRLKSKRIAVATSGS
jgi:hypothetical protein